MIDTPRPNSDNTATRPTRGRADRTSSPCTRRRIRIETALLFLGLAFIAWGKITVLSHHPTARLPHAIPAVLLADVAFLAVVAALIRVVYRWRPTRGMARLALVVATLATTWSVTNALWLVRSDVQIQPGIIAILLRDLKELWPLLATYALLSPLQLVVVFLMVVGMGTVLIRCWVRPQPVGSDSHLRIAMVWLAVAGAAIGLRSTFMARAHLGFEGEVLAFNSHWHAMIALVVGGNHDASEGDSGRRFLTAGQRTITPPQAQTAPCPADDAAGDLPNIVIVLLESVPYRATSMGGAATDPTPYLAYLARQGLSFSNTHVPVSHTTKAFWATLTGSMPAITSDYVEAVPADKPYESLATILGRWGYRSGFFMMSKGTYECGPGLFSNLGFDWAWFRENLQDPSRHLGYMSGDDFCLIRPLVRWARRQPGPFLAMTITTLTHDPFEVPSWFAWHDPEANRGYDLALQCTDAFLRSLVAALDDADLMDNTIVCVLGDHGTSLEITHGQARWNPKEEVLHVPWVIYWPGHIEPGWVIGWPTSQLDVTPTLLALIGCDVSQAGFDGQNALAPTAPQRRLYFSSWYTDSPLGYLEGTRKFVLWPYMDRLLEYDLAADPNETQPRVWPEANEHPIAREILAWQQSTLVNLPRRRYRHKRVFDHWQLFGAGRSAWAVFDPSSTP